MLHPLRYKLNKTGTLNYYCLYPSALPLFLSPYLPTSIPLSHSLPLPPILPPLSLRHTVSIPFSLFFPTLLCSSTPLFLRVFARHSFFVPILSFSLRRTWIQSWLFAHIYTNVEAIYALLCNTCHASLTLSQFNTDNVIRQLVLDIRVVACGVMVLLLRQTAGVDNM